MAATTAQLARYLRCRPSFNGIFYPQLWSEGLEDWGSG
jgi:hypothetical protein